MKTFRDIREESAKSGSELTIFDIDDTLFTTGSMVQVHQDGKLKHHLTPTQFNTHQRKPGEQYDYSEFKSAKIFHDTAIPVRKFFHAARSIVEKNKRRPGSKSIILTARPDLDNRDLFLSTFRKHGFDIDAVRVERTGNNPNYKTVHERKSDVIEKYLMLHKYTRVRLFDDAKQNLIHFLSLKTKYPDTVFQAFLVGHNGSVKRFNG